MKKQLLCSIMLGFVLLAFSVDAYGQRDREKSSNADEYFDESGGFVHRLWYGGGFTLGFSGGTYSSLFQIGVSPMVGYKITDKFSIGPRVSFLYSNYRVRTYTNTVAKANLVSYAAGAFARYKVFNPIFVHTEYEIENEGYAEINVNGDLLKYREQQNNIYVGAGYNGAAGGLLGYEILVLYNVREDENSIDSPFSFRFGLTYKF